MKLFKLDAKGFSLIEIIIALIILGIVIALIGPFLINNLKTFNRESNHIEVQNQAQSAVNTFITQVMAVKGIYAIIDADDHDITLLNTSSNKNIKQVTFIDKDGIASIGFNYNVNPADANYQTLADKNQTTIYARNITEFVLTPIFVLTQTDNNYGTCQGVSIKVTSTKDGIPITVQNEVYFRNYPY